MDTFDEKKLIYCNENKCEKIEVARPGYYFNSIAKYYIECTTENGCTRVKTGIKTIEENEITNKCLTKDTVYYVENSKFIYCISNINGNDKQYLELPKNASYDYEKYYIIDFVKDSDIDFPKPITASSNEGKNIIIKISPYCITQYYYKNGDDEDGSEGKNK